jgi:hypothetical protein
MQYPKRTAIAERLPLVAVMLAALMIEGCSHTRVTAGPMPPWNTPEFVDVLQIVVQICLPNRTVAFQDVDIDLTAIPSARTFVEEREASGVHGHRLQSPPITSSPEASRNTDIVRRWIKGSDSTGLSRYFLGFSEVLNSDGVLSASSTQIQLIGSTDKNQPVFEKHAHRPQDYIGLSTTLEEPVDNKTEFATYWFKLPRRAPDTQFSEWQDPISREDKASREKQRNPTFWNLTHGIPMDIYETGNHAPKIRFKVMSIGNYYDENRFWNRARRAVAEKYYRGLGAKARDEIHFVPKAATNIPAC